MFDKLKINRPALIGYLFLVLLVAGAFWYQSQLAERLKEEEIVRAHNLCQNQNEIRNIMAAILEDARSQVSGSGRSREQLQETVRFYNRAIERLEPKECPPPPPTILEINSENPIQPTITPPRLRQR